jgi:hypothetical protein
VTQINNEVIDVRLGTSSFVTISGSKERVIAMTQILAWFGAAFRVSDSEEIRYSEPYFTSRSPEHHLVKFVQTPLVDAERTCWLPLFYNPVIAKGFPIPPRTNHELGIEMPLEIMTALNGSH